MFENSLREAVISVWQKLLARVSPTGVVAAAVTTGFSLLALAITAYMVMVPAGAGKVVSTVDVPNGTTIRKLAADLKAKGIIRNPSLFVWHARLKGADSRMQAGTYLFNDGMSVGTILGKLAKGDVYILPFAVPEGYSIHQVAIMLEQRGFCRSDAFLAKCSDPVLLKRLSVHGKTVEGYLYPGTYNLVGKQDEEALIATMVSQFNTSHRSRFEKKISASGMTWNQVLTLASMVEKEAVVPAEKPLIASVFRNRLDKGMRLQSDPTAVYGRRAFAGKVTHADVTTPSPYNTYLIDRLPPGPIGNPGAGAIEAVLNPAQTPYLYFVARNDGSHCFSTTLDDHNRAVRTFLKNSSAKDQTQG